MHLTGQDVLRNTVTPNRGLDVLATVISAARRAAPGTSILLDNGDSLQGTPLGDACAAPGTAEPHPWPAMVNALGYDAIGLGNHDFDFGLGVLERITRAITPPVLCASLIKGRIASVQANTILVRSVACSDGVHRDLAIGITSVLPPQTAIWNQRHLVGRVAFDTGVDATRRAVRALRRGGADLVILLCHSGLSPVPDGEGENFSTAVAAQVRGIDAMVLGHTHRLFPADDHDGGPQCDPVKGTVHGVPAVMPGFAAQALGVIDLGLRWSASRGWRVGKHVVALHTPGKRHTPDPQMTRIAAPALAATRDALDAPLARTQTGFNSYFDMLQSGTATSLVARAMRRVIRDRVRDTPLAGLPLLASVAPMAVGGRAGPDHYVDAPAGMIRERHVSMMVPYPNVVWAAVMSGQELWAWAERAATFFAPGASADGLLVDPGAPSFNFDSLHGLHTVIDPFKPPKYNVMGKPVASDGGRIVSLSHAGTPVHPDHLFLVAMTSYRGAGGGAFPGLTHETNIVRTDVDLAHALRDEITGTDLPTHPAPSVWQFVNGLDASVLIETAPAAQAHLNDIARFAPEPAGRSEAGFLRIRVTI